MQYRISMAATTLNTLDVLIGNSNWDLGNFHYDYLYHTNVSGADLGGGRSYEHKKPKVKIVKCSVQDTMLDFMTVG